LKILTVNERASDMLTDAEIDILNVILKGNPVNNQIIARTLNKPLGTVKGRIASAVNKLGGDVGNTTNLLALAIQNNLIDEN
jgi:DNA-binding NarL/FixJ family response regulator